MKRQLIDIKLSGIADIMFDKFIDHSKEVRPPEQKLYLSVKNQLVLPTENIISFLFGTIVAGCTKTIEGKKCKEFNQMQGFINVKGDFVPFAANGKLIKFNGFKKPFWIYESSAPTKSSGGAIIKQEKKKRPVLSLPWELKFQIDLFKNPLIDETKLFNWFTTGGLVIGLGTHRPRFGRFEVSGWHLKDN